MARGPGGAEVEPINPVQQREPFDSPEWVFETKFDGFRGIAYVEGGESRLVSRKGHARRRRAAPGSRRRSRLGSSAGSRPVLPRAPEGPSRGAHERLERVPGAHCRKRSFQSLPETVLPIRFGFASDTWRRFCRSTLFRSA